MNNAGLTRDGVLARMSDDDWRAVIETNLSAVFYTCRAVSRPMMKRRSGSIVNVSSIVGLRGNMGQTNYAASKAGIVGFVRRLAPDLAPRGIAVNAVAPGFIETRLTAAMPVMVREVARRLSALGQGGRPEDVAEVLTFLSSPGADGITGSVVRVCGGAYVGA